MFKGIFGKGKGEDKSKPAIAWKDLTSIEDLKALKNDTTEQYIGIFKHSTRCVISRTVLERLEKSFPSNLAVDMYYIDLLNYREVSNEVANLFQVVHQSPQFLLIKKGEVILHESHNDILQINFEENIK